MGFGGVAAALIGVYAALIGVAAALIGVDAAALRPPAATATGPLLETNAERADMVFLGLEGAVALAGPI